MEPYIGAIGIIGEAHRKIFDWFSLWVCSASSFLTSERVDVSCGHERRTARDVLVYHSSIEIC